MGRAEAGEQGAVPLQGEGLVQWLNSGTILEVQAWDFQAEMMWGLVKGKHQGGRWGTFAEGGDATYREWKDWLWGPEVLLRTPESEVSVPGDRAGGGEGG